MSTITQRDILLGLIVMVIWAANTVVIKYITLEVEPFTGLALRMILASMVFLPFIRWPGREQFWLVVQITVLMAILHWGSLIWAIDKLDASMAAIIMQTQVIFAVLLGRFFFDERFGWRTAGGIAIGIIGVVVLVGLPQNPPSMVGVIGMVFSMMMIALSYARMKALQGVSSVNYMALMHVVGVMPAIGLAFAFETPMQADWAAIDYTILLPMLIYQVIMVSFAHMLWQRLMSRNAMSGLPNLTLLLPILGVMFAVIFLDETITLTMIAGGLLTTVGVGIVMVRKQQRLDQH